MTSKNNYFEFYLEFLKSEIPSFIQILGIPSLLGLFIRGDWILITAIATITGFLLEKYLMVKLRLLIEKELKDQFSFMNRKGLDQKELFLKLDKYTFITVLIFTLITWVFILSIRFN